MKISAILKKKRTLSFEFFPPKETSQEAVLFDTINTLKEFTPDFASITYGAGGSTRNKTMEWSQILAKDFTTMMHLTCYGNDNCSIDKTCAEMKSAGIENILALRGDPPKDIADITKAFDFADGLVSYIKSKHPDFCIGVAGYPETHPQAVSKQADIDHMKSKIDAGADFIITQLFFNNDAFLHYRDSLHKANITVPVVAGIMPIVNYNQVIRFTQMCGTAIPSALLADIEKASQEDVVKIGEEFAAQQVIDLIQQGVDGIHLYTLNKSPSVKNILYNVSQNHSL